MHELDRLTKHWRIVFIAILMFSNVAKADIYSEIALEAQRDNRSTLGRPLPVASHWTTGIFPAAAGWGPKWQLTQIAQGHHLLPWLQLPPATDQDPFFRTFDFEAYARQAVEAVCAHGLPLTLAATQWESILTEEPYRSLPSGESPNVVDGSGGVALPVTISPFGPVEHWHAAGIKWTTTSYMRQLQSWCPDPVMVIFLSNNEAVKLDWTKIESDVRYVGQFGKGRSDSFKRQVMGDAWATRYRALQDGMRAGLTSPAWRKAAKFVGYNAFGPPHFGRWWGWKDYSLAAPNRIDPSPLAWDGGSPSYYFMNSTPETDFTAWSPENEFQNLVFMQEEALHLNPNFWFELSVWDGYVPGGDARKNGERSDNRAYLKSLGQTYSPDRYKGFVQFGMWLNRPRAVREFRDWIQPRDAATEPYFLALVDAVDGVYRNPTLTSYWRQGRLLAVSDYRHPYQDEIPREYAGRARWFLLSADVNGFSPPGISPSNPANVATEIPVFSLALEQGRAPNRTWLVYATSPRQARSEVKILIPDYKNSVTLKRVAVQGSFYEVAEATGEVKPISP